MQLITRRGHFQLIWSRWSHCTPHTDVHRYIALAPLCARRNVSQNHSQRRLIHVDKLKLTSIEYLLLLNLVSDDRSGQNRTPPDSTEYVSRLVLPSERGKARGHVYRWGGQAQVGSVNGERRSVDLLFRHKGDLIC